MNPIDLLLVILVAIVCGTLAQLTSKYSRGGWIVHLGIGFLGALAGTVAARTFNVPKIYNIKIRTVDFPIIYAIIGSVFLLAAIGFFIRPSRR
jgi:uncharacterized membrane protein YeaQ/YmgE (transglycosylase-associated protein family)